MPSWRKVIVHADMDAFYAAVEQLDDPTLVGKPVLVGPNSDRGVVLTASYEARPFGVGSAMPVAQARRRCPHAVFVAPRFERYQELSRRFMEVLGNFSPAVEPLSLDEAFIDMSGSSHLFGPPDAIGRKIKAAVRAATGLNISVGVATTKYVAKVASAHEKPDGLTVVPPDRTVSWLAPLPVNRLWGVGPKTTVRLNAAGLYTIGDIAQQHEAALVQRLGVAGAHFHQLARGHDPRRVTRGRTAASIGSDQTLSEDICSHAAISRHLQRAADRIARRLRAKGYVATGIRVRLKTNRFQMLTRQRLHAQPMDTAESLHRAALSLLESFDHRGPFRLVGLAAFGLSWRRSRSSAGGPSISLRQMDLFDDNRQRSLETTIDGLISRFGKGIVTRARDLQRAGVVADDGVNLDFLDYRDGERLSSPR